jgi:hypothetical protein
MSGYCSGSGYTFDKSERLRLRKELRPVTYRTPGKYRPDGKPTKLVVDREVEVADCPYCGRSLRVRSHMFAARFRMLPRHKKEAP